jgi:hypothetical protein
MTILNNTIQDITLNSLTTLYSSIENSTRFVNCCENLTNIYNITYIKQINGF